MPEAAFPGHPVLGGLVRMTGRSMPRRQPYTADIADGIIGDGLAVVHHISIVEQLQG